MAQTKETNLKQTKEKLKQVAGYWNDLQDLSRSTIYDINNQSANWNKTIKIAELESAELEAIDRNINVEEQKPQKKNEEPPKKVKTKSFIILYILVAFILFFIFGTFTFSVTDELTYVREYLTFSFCLMGVIVLYIGLILLNKNTIAKKLNKMKTDLGNEKDFENEKTIKHFQKKAVSTIGTIFTSVSPIIVMISIIFLFDIPFKLNAFITIILMFLLGLILYFIVRGKSKNQIAKLNYLLEVNQIELNKKFNVEQYPILLKEYEDKVNVIRQSYVDNMNITHKKIAEIYNQIDKIDIVSRTQAKYAQALLDYIYKGAESIKEAFELLEVDKEKIDKQIEENKQNLEEDNDTNEINNTIEENSKLTKQQMKEKYKDKYLKSHRRINDIVYYTFLSVCIVGISGATIASIVLGLIGLNDLIMSVIIAPYIIGFVSGIVAGVFGNARQKYCKFCGSQGIITDTQTSSNFHIEGEVVRYDFQTKGGYDGHLTYKDGKPYLEKIVEETTTTKTMICPCCFHSWKVSHKKTTKR